MSRTSGLDDPALVARILERQTVEPEVAYEEPTWQGLYGHEWHKDPAIEGVKAFGSQPLEDFMIDYTRGNVPGFGNK